MSSLLLDIRFALRLLAKDRSFTVTALLTLTICIGANTAMFGVVRSVLFKPLPFPESDRVVLLYNSYPNAGAPRAGTSVPDYIDRLAAVPALEELALYRPEGMTFGDEHGAERLASIRATPSFFRLVRVTPVHGRLFRDDEGERGRALKAVLSYAFWQRKFGGDAGIVGRTIRLNGNPFDVVGIMPREFTFLQNNIDVFVPAPLGPDDKADDRRHSNLWQMVARLKAGATIEQARQQVDAVNAGNDARFPEFRQILKDARFHTVVDFLQDDVVRDVKGVLYLLWGGVLLVLLLGCVNIANLVLIRSTSRRGEMATRQALGGNLPRLTRQILTETTLLSMAGGVMGTLAGSWTMRLVAALDLDKLPRGYEIGLDPVIIASVLGVTMLTGIMLGVAPVSGLRRVDLIDELREEGRAGTSGRRATLVRRVLATVQVAVAFVLLAGAGLLLASFRAVLRIDPGFQPARVVTATVNLPARSYRDGPALVGFERRALQAVRALPHVEAAGLTTAVPFGGAPNPSVILAEGHVRKAGESILAPNQITVSTGYFAAMRIPILRGRDFDDRDGPDAPATVILDERLARRFWPDRDPIGRRLYFPGDAKDVSRITPDTMFFTVIGVVKDVVAMDPRPELTPVGTFYLPYEQVAPRGFTFAVRTRDDSGSIVNGIRRQIAQIDPEVPVFRPRRMQEWIDRALVVRRVSVVIATAFGLVALLLSAIGIYGVLACSVSQRRREIGVRMALGSSARGIFVLVLQDGARIVGAGLVIGVGGWMAIRRIMTAHLVGVAPMDPAVIAGVVATLAGMAFVAILIPSWRASGIDPIAVLNK